MQKINSLIAVALLAGLTALSTGCGDDKSPAQLRVVHASPDAPNVDVLVDGKKVLTNVPYQTASGYLKIKAGTRRIQVNATGASTSVINVSQNFTTKQFYTAFAIGPVASISLLVAADNNTAPASGQVKVRIVHGSPSAGPVDVYVTAPGADLATTTATLSNVPFKTVSDYLAVPAGSYQVRVTPAGVKTPVAIDSGTVALTAGQIRTIVALDKTGGGSPLTAIILDDLN